MGAQDKTVNAKLDALESRVGKKPNIIYILADDVGWGEMGWQGGGKHRGTPTPQLDEMALEGMRFWSAYAEPSCTPSRIAINTGRHPVRTGLLSVLWPGQDEGLSGDEVTVAEVLSDAGYSTAMWGKWHLGEDYGRRNTMFHYSGGVLAAIRHEDFKIHITEGHGGLPGMDFYNVIRDPGEKYGELYPGLFAVTPIQMLLREHMKMIQKFPHRVSEVTPKGAELTPHD
jgi:arylsulfatase A-like enzyme